MKLFSIKLLKSFVKKCLSLMALSGFIPQMVLASSSFGNNFKAVEQLDSLREMISGPVLRDISIIMIAAMGAIYAFGDWGDGFKRLIQIVFFLSCASLGSSFLF